MCLLWKIAENKLSIRSENNKNIHSTYMYEVEVSTWNWYAFTTDHYGGYIKIQEEMRCRSSETRRKDQLQCHACQICDSAGPITFHSINSIILL